MLPVLFNVVSESVRITELNRCIADDITIVHERTACCIIQRHTGVILLTTAYRSAVVALLFITRFHRDTVSSVIIHVRLSREYKPPIVLLTIANESPHFNVTSILYYWLSSFTLVSMIRQPFSFSKCIHAVFADNIHKVVFLR